MKLILFSIFFVFASTASAQDKSTVCRSIIMKAPESVQTDRVFEVAANYDGSATAPIPRFDWIVIRDEETSQSMNASSIKIESKNPRNLEEIIVIAQPINRTCSGFGISRTIVVPNIGSPYIIDEYQNLGWTDERARLGNVLLQMKDLPDSELFVTISFEKLATNVKKAAYILRLANYLTTKGLRSDRITFLISTPSEKRTMRFQPYPSSRVNEFPISDVVVVKVEQIKELKTLLCP